LIYALIQAPMAGVQGSAMAIAVSNVGRTGLTTCCHAHPAGVALANCRPCGPARSRPFNVNFFCHTPPVPDVAREATWRNALAPFYAEAGQDITAVPAGAGRVPFSEEAAGLLEAFRPAVVSFHFGLA
jgi:nitronate monooxygenase